MSWLLKIGDSQTGGVAPKWDSVSRLGLVCKVDNSILCILPTYKSPKIPYSNGRINSDTCNRDVEIQRFDIYNRDALQITEIMSTEMWWLTEDVLQIQKIYIWRCTEDIVHIQKMYSLQIGTSIGDVVQTQKMYILQQRQGCLQI